MNDQTILLLNELSEKLGTTTEHLWQVLTKQALISGVINTTICILISIGTFLSLEIINKLKSKWIIKYDMETIKGFWIIYITCIIVVNIFILSKIYNIITAFMNPEYWALQEIINLLR